MSTSGAASRAEAASSVREFTPALILRNAVFVCLAAALAAQLSMPVSESSTPFTLQTLAVLLAGPLAGARAGTAGILLYLLAGALGLPVFADGRGGSEVLSGPTAGFLWSFLLLPTPLAHLARRIDGSWSALWFGCFLVGHLLILLFGFGWLAFGAGVAVTASSWSVFLPGAVLKSMLGVLVLRFTPTHVTRSASRRRPRIEPE
ncbi:MAG: biotin transporter BioY [Pseudomonadales bacterium]|jgi:biotin transport system substrate-specific component|nr:biotin transporter BioY [Pseudomonadales bacterium]